MRFQAAALYAFVRVVSLLTFANVDYFRPSPRDTSCVAGGLVIVSCTLGPQSHVISP